MKALSFGVLLAITFSSFSAFAQDPQTPAPAPTDGAAGQTPPPTQPAQPAQPAQGAQTAEGAKPAEGADEGHFRWGISGMGGSFFPGPTTIAFGAEGRVGYALDRTLTLYGSLGSVAGIGFGGEVSNNNSSLSVSAVSYWYIGANVDALVAGPLFVGAGAAFGKGAWGVVSQSAGTNGAGQEVIAAGGFMPSADARLGLHFGKTKDNGKRGGFVLALDLRVLIAPDSAETKQSASSTGGASQSVTTDTTAIGYSPMLMLGYDMR